MNPPVSKGPKYDKGFRDGYHQMSVDQVLDDLFRLRHLTQDDIKLIEDCLKEVIKAS